MNVFLKDLKHSIRLFLKSPGFSVTAVLALALEIGAVIDQQHLLRCPLDGGSNPTIVRPPCFRL
ncbi:MAG: hypothetical protein DMG57_43730 [Acidobacteria bacterium]|nr:MAG: hypothetical protein DMG57_43730 [Acidobacteriota bacterium]